MNIYLYQIPLVSFAIPSSFFASSQNPARPPISETIFEEIPASFHAVPPRRLGTSLFLNYETEPLGKARHLLKISRQGMTLYRKCCFDLIGILEKKDTQALSQGVQDAIRQSRALLERMPDYSHESGPLRHLYSSLLQPFVSIQKNFGKLLMLAERGWSFTSLQIMIGHFLLNEADRFMEFLDKEGNGYFVDMTCRQLAKQVIDYFYRRTSKNFFKDGLLLMRAPPQVEPKQGFVNIGGEMHFSVIDIAEDWGWPVDPEKNEALKIYLDILGWKMWMRTNSDDMTYAIDFGPYAILEGYPVNRKVAEDGSALSSQILGKMTALALFEDLNMLNEVRAVASGDSSMQGPALLVINRIPQLKPMVQFETYGEFVAKANEILENEKMHLGLMRRRESDKRERVRRTDQFTLGPVTAIRFLREEMLRRKPEWRLEPRVEEQWKDWEQKVSKLSSDL